MVPGALPPLTWPEEGPEADRIRGRIVQQEAIEEGSQEIRGTQEAITSGEGTEGAI